MQVTQSAISVKGYSGAVSQQWVFSNRWAFFNHLTQFALNHVE